MLSNVVGESLNLACSVFIGALWSLATERCPRRRPNKRRGRLICEERRGWQLVRSLAEAPHDHLLV